MRKAFGFLILICLTLSMTSCFDGPWSDVLENVPYCPQEQYNYCASACIQMWAWYDRHFYVTQNQIANYIGVNSPGSYPENVVEGVNAFTDSYGFMVEYNNTNVGQDSCIAACIAAIKDFTPAIMPFYGGIHGVLVIGYKWHYENNVRIADEMHYHDPDPSKGPDRDVSAYVLKTACFWDVKNKYYAIVGKRGHWIDGIYGYNIFISEGGTFYGGPNPYDPLTFDPFEN